jgi:hypothetical protein
MDNKNFYYKCTRMHKRKDLNRKGVSMNGKKMVERSSGISDLSKELL